MASQQSSLSHSQRLPQTQRAQASPAAPETPEEQSAPAPWGALWVLALGLAMIVLDGSIVNVSIPTIISEIHISLTDAQWVTSLYNIVLAALLLPLGKLGDARGRKRVFQIGLIVFVLGSAYAAAAQDASMLLQARALQGIGGAMIMPSTLSTVSATFRGKSRAAAFGVWGAVASAAAAIGPLLGGWLTQSVGWRWIFLVNLPLGLGVLIAASLWVPETGGKAARRDAVSATSAASAVSTSTSAASTSSVVPSPAASNPAAGVDIAGILISALASAFLVFGLIEGETYGWWSATSPFTLGSFTWSSAWGVSPVPVSLALGVVLFAVFVWLELARAKAGKAVILDMRLFTIATFSWGNLAAGAISAGEFALVFVLPLYLINARSLDTLQTGGILAGMALGAFFSGAAARHLAERLGAAGTVQLGLVLEILGVLGSIVFMPEQFSPLILIVCLVVYGLGLGLASAQLTSVVLSQVPVAQSGEGSATQSTIRQLGTAIGAAISGSSLSVALHMVLPSQLASIDHLPSQAAQGIVDAVSNSAGNMIAGLRAQGTHGQLGQLGPRVVDTVTQGFIQGGQWSMGVAVVMLLIGLLASMQVRRAARHDTALGDAMQH